MVKNRHLLTVLNDRSRTASRYATLAISDNNSYQPLKPLFLF